MPPRLFSGLTEQVRIDFESPISTPDSDSSTRVQNHYLLRRVGQDLPSQWVYFPAQHRVRVVPYDPAERVLQSQYWFYDLTAISDLNDYHYAFVQENADRPIITGTPRRGLVPYRTVRFVVEPRGQTLVLVGVTYHPYQDSDVKRANGCTTGAGWPSVKQTVSRHSQASAADLISVAGHSLKLHQTPIEDQCFP